MRDSSLFCDRLLRILGIRSELLDSAPVGRVVDERGEAAQSGLFAFRAHHPETRDAPIPQSLRLVELPRPAVGAKRILKLHVELAAPDLVGVQLRLLLVAADKDLSASLLHAPLLDQFSHSRGVDDAPDAARQARREAYGIAMCV